MTLTQLLEHGDWIITALWDRSNIDTIDQDFANAFDKVDHNIVLTNLRNSGIQGRVYEGIKKLLKTRTQSVAVNGKLLYQ